MDDDEVAQWEAVDALREQIKNHPAMQTHLRRESVLRTHTMHEANTAELIAWIDVFSDPVNGMAVMQRGEDETRHQFNDELVRRWHNYVASSKTLIDHVRTFRKHESDAFNIKCDRLREQILSAPVVAFTQGLRNYILHRWWPETFLRWNLASGVVVVGPGSDYREFEIGCHTQHLLTDWKWSASERVYLREAGEEFLLLDSVTDYTAVLTEFYERFWAIHFEEHRGALEELEALEDRLQALTPQWEEPDDPFSDGPVPPRKPSKRSKGAAAKRKRKKRKRR